MMLAKLSGMPIRTQISSVTTPASSSGTSVSSTSPKRRSVIHSRMVIDSERPDAGLDERVNDRAPGFEDRDRPAGRVRLDREHRAAKLTHGLVVVGIAVRGDLDARLPSSVSQSRRGRREVVERDRRRLEEVAQIAMIELERQGEHGLGALAHAPAAAMASVVMAAASRFAATAPGPVLLSARRMRPSARCLRASTISASVGAGARRQGRGPDRGPSRRGDRRASPSWPAGTKLAMVGTVRPRARLELRARSPRPPNRGRGTLIALARWGIAPEVEIGRDRIRPWGCGGSSGRSRNAGSRAAAGRR